MCDCMNMAGYGPDSWGKHHHINCEKYGTEKHSYLFYYEETEDAWVPVPERTEHLIDAADQLEDGEKMQLEFKRVDMTDKQYAELPDC